MIRAIELTTTPADGSGNSVDRYSGSITGLIEGVLIDYSGASSTIDVTVSTTGKIAQNVIVASNNNPGYFIVRAQAKDAAGSAITGVYDRLPIAGGFTVTVAQANEDDTVRVVVFVGEG